MRSSMEARLRRIEDELAIRASAARFSDCANERDFEGFADLWSARAVWEIGPPLPARAEAIVDMLKRLLAPQRGFMQMTHSGVVRLDGDRAKARFVKREHARGQTSEGVETYYENLAVYNDQLMREADGKWRFARPAYVYRFLDTSPRAGRIFPLDADLRAARVDAGGRRAKEAGAS